MKNILITGGTKGIGLAVRQELTSLGHRVFSCSRSDENSKFHARLDLNSPNAAKILYKQAKEALGRIDVLINNAGEYIYSPIENMDENELLKLINLNLNIPCLLCSYVADDMKKHGWGRIINIGSISGVVGEANAAIYAATKAGLAGLTKSLALEFAQYNITVNQINPGWVETNLTNNALDEQEKRETLDVIPQRRFIEPYEIAKLCKYLISDDSKGLTGQSINLCAGLSCGC